MIISNSWAQYLYDWGAYTTKIMSVYNLLKAGVVLGGIAGISAIFAKLVGIGFVTSAAAAVVPSISAATSIANIASNTGLPLQAVYGGYNALMNKLSTSQFKGIPSEGEMMNYLASVMGRV
jgi:alanine dehydrogenase